MNLSKMVSKLRNSSNHMTTGRLRKERDFYKREKANIEKASKRNG